MPRRSALYSTPRAWLRDGEWPTGRFAADAPDAVAYAVHIAITLGVRLDGVNKSQAATAAGLKRSTLYDLLGGHTWADLVTLAKLEQALDVSLWPPAPPVLDRMPD